jgi:hypothetical protein
LDTFIRNHEPQKIKALQTIRFEGLYHQKTDIRIPGNQEIRVNSERVDPYLIT